MSLCYGESLVGTSGINGDSFIISPDHSTFLLADGASGAGTEGKVLMSKLCAEMVKNNPLSDSGLSSKAYLDKMIWKINNELISVSQKNKHYIFGTLVICAIQDNTATVAAIGDSPAYFIHKNFIVRVAQTKKTYQNLVDAGFYSEEELKKAVHKLPEHMWSMFERFIPMVVPKYSVEECRMDTGDCIVLCCDGISDYIEPPYIKDTIKAGTLPQSIHILINAAKERSIKEKKCTRYDDLTMVVYCH